MIYLVSYDLRKPGRDYKNLHDAIKKYGDWAHPLESVWLINTTQNANQIYDHLRPTIDENDYLLVIETGRDRQGWLSKDVWTWLDGRKAA